MTQDSRHLLHKNAVRYIEIDLLRSLAILMMVLYHLAFDMSVLYGWNIDVFSGGFWLFARSSANLFLLLVGISFAISWERTKKWGKYLRRGLFIFSCGLLVSLATYLFDPSTYVRFGILHLIGAAMILLPLFAPLKLWNALVGLGMIAVGTVVLKGMTIPTSLFIPLGLPTPSFETVDYFPLFPWFGVILLGVALGHLFYVRNRAWRAFMADTLNESRFSQAFSFLSRHSLLIYLLHQPVLLLLLRLTIGAPK
jgi:uncharacterized membrane protein